MKKKILSIIETSKSVGWVMEPYAKDMLAQYKLPVTNFCWAKTCEDAVKGAARVGYPLVAKIVSPDIVHKTEVGGVVVGVRDDDHLKEVFGKFKKLKGFDGVLLDEMLPPGMELIVGAKSDPQFDIVVLAGIGGTAVEVYKDVAIRMAPVSENEAFNALSELKGSALLKGHRGADAVNLKSVTRLIADFSKAAYDLRHYIESIDLNPVIATSDRAVIADARIILR